MSKRTEKPVTAAAKAESAFLADCRKKHPEFDGDVKRFGLGVAIYNAGWLAGNTHRKRKGR